MLVDGKPGRRLLALLTAAVAASAFVTGVAQAAAGPTVAVVVVPDFEAGAYARQGAVGLFVPGAGTTVSRERAIASLVRGRVVSQLVALGGKPTLRLAREPAKTTIYVALPPPGSHKNTVRYPIAIVGPGYRGLLTSSSTRIDGLVSLADIAPTAEAIGAGARAAIEARPDGSAVETLSRLDARLGRLHDARRGVTIALVAWLVLLASIGFLARSATLARAAILLPPAALATSLALSAVGVDDPRSVILAMALLPGAGAIVLGRRADLLVPTVVVFLCGYLAALAVWPEVNALAALGPHPESGGRFYGVTNQVETLLLAPSLAAASVVGGRYVSVVVAPLLAAIGWSRAGADGGGVFVVIAAFAVLLAGRARVAVTPARLVAAAALVVAAGLALIGADALLGGSSHVTGSLDGGAGGLLDDLDRRLRISWAGTTAATHTTLLCLLALGGLAWLGLRGRRSTLVVAMLTAIGVSLVVNDTPVDALGYGALGLLALAAWDGARQVPRTAFSSRSLGFTCDVVLAQRGDHVLAGGRRGRA